MYTTRSKFRRANFDVNQTLCWRMLSDDQCEEIYVTAAELLERTGAQVLSAEALDIFAAHGCWVEGDMVRIPTARLEWALRAAPSRITLCDRAGRRAALLETENVHYLPGSGATRVVDPATGTVRDFLLSDVADLARLSEGFSNLALVSAGGVPSDSEGSKTLRALEALLTYTTKPVLQEVCCAGQAAAAADMAAAVAGGAEKLRRNPYLVLSIACTEARSHSENALGAVIYAAKNGIPFVYHSKLVSGLTAPKAPAGTLVLALANTLVALVLAELVSEGAPVVAGASFSLRSGESAPTGAPEAGLMGAGFANLMRYLRIPSAGTAGISDSCLSDAQMGAETTYGLLTAALAGTNLVSGGGLLESGKLLSLSLLAMGDEVMGMLYRIMKSAKIDEDRMARGVIDEIGPGGYYLGAEHTNVFFKSEQYWPNLVTRMRIDDWIQAGEKTMGTRAGEYVRGLLAAAAEPTLDAHARQALRDVVTAAEAKL